MHYYFYLVIFIVALVFWKCYDKFEKIKSDEAKALIKSSQLKEQLETFEELKNRLDDGTYTKDDISYVSGMLAFLLYTYSLKESERE